MSVALFVSILLLGTPVQSVEDSVSAQRVQKLESRITELEKQVLEYRAREDYFQSILASQRWTFGTVVALFSALVGLVGFGMFKRYVNRVEETQEEMEAHVSKKTTELRNLIEDLEGNIISVWDGLKDIEAENIKEKIEAAREGGNKQSSILLGITYSTKIFSKRDVSNGDINRASAELARVKSDINSLKGEDSTMSGPIYDAVTNGLSELEELSESGGERLTRQIREDLRDVEVARTSNSDHK